MAARRCSICLTNYPLDDEFELCETCGNDTDKVRNAKPIKLKEARSRQNHGKFNRIYEEWDESHDASRLDPALDPDIERRFPIGLEPDNLDELKKARERRAAPLRQQR